MLSAAPASWLRVQNLAFTDNQVSAIYDWDSVALVPEPALVGSASVMHPIDGRLERPDPLPPWRSSKASSPTTRQYAVRRSATTSTKSSPPAKDGSPATAPAASTPTTYSESSPTSISRGAGPASSAISWIGPPRHPHTSATWSRRSGAATDRMICARPRLASRAPTEHCGIHPDTVRRRVAADADPGLCGLDGGYAWCQAGPFTTLSLLRAQFEGRANDSA
jgi:hypothetical protein